MNNGVVKNFIDFIRIFMSDAQSTGYSYPTVTIETDGLLNDIKISNPSRLSIYREYKDVLENLIDKISEEFTREKCVSTFPENFTNIKIVITMHHNTIYGYMNITDCDKNDYTTRVSTKIPSVVPVTELYTKYKNPIFDALFRKFIITHITKKPLTEGYLLVTYRKGCENQLTFNVETNLKLRKEIVPDSLNEIIYALERVNHSNGDNDIIPKFDIEGISLFAYIKNRSASGSIEVFHRGLKQLDDIKMNISFEYAYECMECQFTYGESNLRCDIFSFVKNSIKTIDSCINKNVTDITINTDAYKTDVKVLTLESGVIQITDENVISEIRSKMIELLSKFLIPLYPEYDYSLDIIDNYGQSMPPNTVGFILKEAYCDETIRLESGFMPTTFDKIINSEETD